MRRIAGFLTAFIVAMSGAAVAMDRSGSLPAARDVFPQHENATAPRQLSAGGDVSVPIGWIEFCTHAENASDCQVSPADARKVATTAALWRKIERINRNVNAAIAPMSDMDNYGVEERWTYPANGRGDCEDYVLLKRRLLIEAGVPRQALLITVVRESNGDGHAVLTLATTNGDFVLDNKRDAIRLWRDTGYSFVKRQSQEDPNRWVDLRQSGGDAIARR